MSPPQQVSFGGEATVHSTAWTAVGQEITKNWFWLIVWGVLAAPGIMAQVASSRLGQDSYQLERTSYRYA